MKFDVIIPTYKREDDLSMLLDSIFSQSQLPTEVIVVDDAEISDEFLQTAENDMEESGIVFTYHQKQHDMHPRGSSTSRNLGMKMANHDICFVLDDDLILDSDFFEKIMNVWEEGNTDDLIGVSGVIKNNRRRGKLERFYTKIFGLSSNISWDVNDVGFQDWDDWISKREKGYYIHGGVCSYKKELVQSIGGFTARSGGRDALEDADFCLRAKQVGYHFIIEPKAKVIHNHSPSGREGSLLSGFKEGYNRKRIFGDHCVQTIRNRLWFAWANIGWILRQFLTGKFAKGVGMIKGILTPQN